LLCQALCVEPILCRHRAIMDGFDPDRRIDLIVDEWGAWHPVMEGTPPRFLRQQNTLRDALVAALSLDIFNRHADKVAMANIAQTINVLQAMCLTDGPRMFRTPTHHVYAMYAAHQGGESAPVRAECDSIFEHRYAGIRQPLPRIAGSASVKDGLLTVSITNTHPTEDVTVTLDVRGRQAAAEGLRTLAAADIHAHNDFDSPDRVQPADGELDGLTLHLPPASVNVATIRLSS